MHRTLAVKACYRSLVGLAFEANRIVCLGRHWAWPFVWRPVWGLTAPTEHLPGSALTETCHLYSLSFVWQRPGMAYDAGYHAVAYNAITRDVIQTAVDV